MTMTESGTVHMMNDYDPCKEAETAASAFASALREVLRCNYHRQMHALAMHKIQNWHPLLSLEDIRTVRLDAGRQTGKSYGIIRHVSWLADPTNAGAEAFTGPALVILPHHHYTRGFVSLWEQHGNQAVLEHTPIVTSSEWPGHAPQLTAGLDPYKGRAFNSIWVDEATHGEREGWMDDIEQFAAEAFPNDEPAVLVKLG